MTVDPTKRQEHYESFLASAEKFNRPNADAWARAMAAIGDEVLGEPNQAGSSIIALAVLRVKRWGSR